MALMNACNVHLVYVSTGVYRVLKIKPFKGGVPDPISMEMLESALSNIRGRGRPRSKLLNFVVRNKKEVNDTPVLDEHITVSNRSLPDSQYDPDEFPQLGPVTFPEREQILNLNTDDLEPDEVSALNTALTNYQENVNVIANSELENKQSTVENSAVTSEINEVPETRTAIPPKPITWSVGTGLVYVTYDQIQGEIMAVEDFLKMGKPKEELDLPENMKGGNDLSFLDEPNMEKLSEAENMKGRNTVDLSENIEQGVDDMFAETARKNKCFVPLERLQKEVLHAFKPSLRPPPIDPYSSLEDVGDTEAELSLSVAPENEKDHTDSEVLPASGYYMRERKVKRSRYSDKPLRESRTVVNYADLVGSGSELEIAPKRPRKVKPVPSEPSNVQIAAQGVMSEPPKEKHPVPLLPRNKCFHCKDPANVKPVKRNKTKILDPIDGDDDDTVDLSVSSNQQAVNPPTEAEQKGKGEFKTMEHGIKIQKEERYFLCPVCNIHKASMQRLNDHFKR